MNNSRDYNKLLREYDQIEQVIPMLSEATCDLAIRALSKRLTEIECSLDLATSRTLKEILADKKAQILPPKNEH